ncbi:MAG: N-acetyl sugar amidotransferase [Candidatus Omnitrophica bacterium]|nr:N-acetyl sugar amidotransferase [Candidatus Omnitrophota bacterium]
MAIQAPKIRYCTRCVYPGVAATPLTFDEKGVCSGCRTHEEQKTVDWGRRRQMFEKLMDRYRSKDGSNYDLVIAVSGGKDSFWQSHLLTKEFGLKVLFVCYAENNHTDVGMRNIQRMKDNFKGDFLHFTPEVNVLQKLNRMGMLQMGDPNWHTHIGIMTLPIVMAAKFGVKLFIYGEHGFMNLGGMHSYNDLVEFTKKYRTEHMCRGFDWFDFCEETEGLTPQDFIWAKYPSDEEIDRLGLRGIFISNYFGWNQLDHLQKMIDLYGFELYDRPFARTYRLDSNLNDIHDNGVHDYMKFIKFGYGRATDHACRDIRNGVMSRAEGIEKVRGYDAAQPEDMSRWLEYTGWTREIFDEVADRFRDPRVWVKNESGTWIKDNIWDHD